MRILAKCEYLNPSGSIKDRIAQHMINQAERSGQLKPGMTVVAATSGNTGAAIAMACALRGYDYIVITNEKTSKEKVDAMRAYGGERVSPAASPRSPGSLPEHREQAVRGEPWQILRRGSVQQPVQRCAREATLGPEIWKQTRVR